MSSHAFAFWTVAPGRGEIRQEPLPPPTPADVVVRALHSGVSRGTEALVFHGHVPAEEYQRMRAPFQAGDFPVPVKYGYASVGVVEQGPAELVGRTVFVLHPHQTRYVVPAAAVHPVPDHVPPRRAILAANLETAVNAVWDAALVPGSRVAVVGGGAVGCLVAWLAGRIPGCEVTLVDIRDARAAVAARLGVAFAGPAAAPADCDVVFHASASADGLATAVRLAGVREHGHRAELVRRRGWCRPRSAGRSTPGAWCSSRRRSGQWRRRSVRGGRMADGSGSRCRCWPIRRSTCSSRASAGSTICPR